MSNVQIARFSEIESQGPRFAAELDLPLAAYQKMTAEEFYLLLSSPKLGGPFATDPGISDDQGLVAAIVKCSPGQGPYLHAHYNTLENFVALDGSFRITWGDMGENETIIDPLDMVSVPRGVVRAFANATDKPAHIMAFIRGNTPEDFADVAMTPAAADDLLQTFGDGTVDKIREIGWRFDASVDAPTARVSPDTMEAQVARFARLTAKDADGLATYAMMARGRPGHLRDDGARGRGSRRCGRPRPLCEYSGNRAGYVGGAGRHHRQAQPDGAHRADHRHPRRDRGDAVALGHGDPAGRHVMPARQPGR